MTQALPKDVPQTLRRWKRYPAYKDSGIDWLSEIPEDWRVMLIKRVASVRYGLGQPPPESINGTPLIRATNIKSGSISEESMLYVDPDEVPESRDAILSPGEIIVVRSGAYTGDSAIIPIAYAGAIAGYDMVLTPKKGFSPFFAWQILSAEVRELQFGFHRLRAAQPHLNAEELKETIVVVPPLPEQQAIASFLDRETAKIDALIAKKERLIELLQEKRTAIISHAVTKGLDPTVPMKNSGIECLGKIPRHWNIIKLGRLCNVTKLTGFEYTKFWKTIPEGDIIALRGLNIKNNRLILDDVERISSELSNQLFRSKLFAGDIVFPCTGTIGNGALIEEDNKFHINQNIAKITPGSKLNSKFTLYVLISQNMQYQISYLNASDFQPVLLIGTIRDIKLQIPPKIEQDSIVDWLDRKTFQIDALINKTHTSIEQLKEYRTALISAAVTGKIDVRNEVAS